MDAQAARARRALYREAVSLARTTPRKAPFPDGGREMARRWREVATLAKLAAGALFPGGIDVEGKVRWILQRVAASEAALKGSGQAVPLACPI